MEKIFTKRLYLGLTVTFVKRIMTSKFYLTPRSHMDAVDRKLLTLMQEDASLQHSQLASEVGLSVTGVHKRLKRLKNEGYIKKTTTVLERSKLGLDLMCFLNVTFKDNVRPKNISDMRQAVSKLPEILECYSLTGSNDAIIKIVVRDHTQLREFLERLSKTQTIIERIETCIVLEEFKEGAPLPL
jgi:DNA-binding Lrp family transcriptional regulator